MFFVVMKYCRVTSNEESWEKKLDIPFKTKEEAQTFLKENGSKLTHPMISNRMLFKIVEEDNGRQEA